MTTCPARLTVATCGKRRWWEIVGDEALGRTWQIAGAELKRKTVSKKMTALKDIEIDSSESELQADAPPVRDAKGT
jgi:hypothetical protein